MRLTNELFFLCIVSLEEGVKCLSIEGVHFVGDLCISFIR